MCRHLDGAAQADRGEPDSGDRPEQHADGTRAAAAGARNRTIRIEQRDRNRRSRRGSARPRSEPSTARHDRDRRRDHAVAVEQGCAEHADEGAAVRCRGDLDGRSTSATSAMMPPSPLLSARRIRSTMYLTVTTRSSDQTTSDSAPNTCGSVAVACGCRRTPAGSRTAGWCRCRRRRRRVRPARAPPSPCANEHAQASRLRGPSSASWSSASTLALQSGDRATVMFRDAIVTASDGRAANRDDAVMPLRRTSHRGRRRRHRRSAHCPRRSSTPDARETSRACSRSPHRWRPTAASASSILEYTFVRLTPGHGRRPRRGSPPPRSPSFAAPAPPSTATASASQPWRSTHAVPRTRSSPRRHVSGPT